MTDATPSAVELRVARLVDRGMPYDDAVRLAPHLSDPPAAGPAVAGSPAIPATLAAAAADPENAAAIAAAAAGGDHDSDAREFLSRSAEELAALPNDEFKRGLRAARKAGLL